MNQSKAKKAKFFAAHPYCCFCGGGVPATTEDHIPGRTIFENKAWPEGFVFPACRACNYESSDDEVVLALITRVSEKEKTPNQHKEIQSKIHEFKKQHPEIAKNIRHYTRAAEKRLYESLNISPWNPDTQEPRKAAVFPRETFERIENFGRKLGKALHYLHTKKILPKEGVVNCKAITKVQLHLIADDFFQSVSHTHLNHSIIRNAKPLVDQFVYRYLIDPETLAGLYIVAFGTDAVILLIKVEPRPGLLPQT